ncbi:MAG: molybdopterin-dependent oxidoreductase [Anaerolineaceae bacterium]
MVTVTIDGKQIEIPEGTTVLRAAQSAGIEIPTLCDHPHLTPYGGCRLCLVEVEGARTLQPSCTLPVSNNMVVKTATQKVKDARKFVLTLIFSERNHFCPYCQVSGGDCELQNSAYQEDMTHWPLQPNWQPYPMDASHPYIILENNRCILCRRCVRACGELVGNYTLGFEERGASSLLVADTGVALGDSSCISCGTCVQVCPTGALIDRWSAYRGHDEQAEQTSTICVGCSVGCGIDVFTRDNNLLRIDGNWDAPVNEGVICEIGRFKPLDEKCDRIVTPMVRKNGNLKATTWEEALKSASAALKPLKGKSADGIAAVISTRQPIEAISNFKSLFAEGLDCDLVTTTEEGAYTESAAKFADSLGIAFEGKLEDIINADGFMLLGTDVVKDHQVAGFFIKRVLGNGPRLLIMDSEENSLAELANKVLKGKKGTFEDALSALSAAIVKLGLAKGSTTIKATELDEFASKTGLKSEDFLDAAFVIAASQKPVILYEKGVSPAALQSFAKLIGAVLISVKGNANSLAAAQLGLEKPVKVGNHQAVVVVLGDGEISQKMLNDFSKVPFKVVIASSASALTAMADVVLPAANWLEQEGHYLSLEGRLQKANRCLVPSAEVRSTDAILMALAESVGVKLSSDWSTVLRKRVAITEIIE